MRRKQEQDQPLLDRARVITRVPRTDVLSLLIALTDLRITIHICGTIDMFVDDVKVYVPPIFHAR